MKKFRKISALMLALALICALSISAFAARTDSADEAFYRFDAYANASIAQRSTSIAVSAEGSVTYARLDGTASCAYSYENASGVLITDSFTKDIYETDGAFSYTKGYTSATCSKMREATYYVAVDIQTDYGNYEFAPNSLVVSYS